MALQYPNPLTLTLRNGLSLVSMDKHTVKQLATLAGVSVRTLHYYDEISLLKPAIIGENNYRYYDNESLLRLQHILFYREMDVELAEIKRILDDSDFDSVAALQAHRQTLQTKIERLNKLIQTVDTTILHLIGELNMSNKQIFQGFSEEEQKQHDQEATNRWGDTATSSIKKWNSYGKARQQEILDEGNAIYADIAAAMDQGAESDAVQTILVRWHDHLRYFYEPSIEILGGLGNMYHDDPRFSKKFAAIHPNLPSFLQEAIAVYVVKLGVA